jgi:hypothetical protein
MIGIGLGVDWGSVSLNKTAVVFETEYQAVLDRGTALGYTLPSYSQQILQNNLLTAMKSSGVWAKLDVFYNFANDGSAEFGTLNWKSPTTRQCTFETSPSNFISNQGIQGTGLGFISTNFNPTIGTNNYVQNNASRFLYMYAAGASSNVSLDGILLNTRNSMLRQLTSAQRINQAATNTNPTFDYNSTRGMKSIHRTNATNVELFNGTTQESRTLASSTMENSVQTILKASSSTVFATHTVSMYAMGASLVSENAAFVADYNTYINALI